MPRSIRSLAKSSAPIETLVRPVYERLVESRPIRAAKRKRLAQSYYRQRLDHIRRWAPLHTENDNFYYALTTSNQADLASLIAAVTGDDLPLIRQFMDELLLDDSLRLHIESNWANESTMRDASLGYGRRIGWYAFVRALKPRLVVETGVHQGLGSCVLTAALLRNVKEGYPGQYIGTDIDAKAGALFSGTYKDVGEILYGDSINSLEKLRGPIDIFINDSDHNATYEALEYETIRRKLGHNSLILGDNSHASASLREFALGEHRPFIFFKEEPADHWYPGAGIGVCPSRLPLGTYLRG